MIEAVGVGGSILLYLGGVLLWAFLLGKARNVERNATEAVIASFFWPLFPVLIAVSFLVEAAHWLYHLGDPS